MKDWFKDNWKWLAGGACGVLVTVVAPVSADVSQLIQGACVVAFGRPAVDMGKRIADAIKRAPR